MLIRIICRSVTLWARRRRGDVIPRKHQSKESLEARNDTESSMRIYPTHISSGTSIYRLNNPAAFSHSDLANSKRFQNHTANDPSFNETIQKKRIPNIRSNNADKTLAQRNKDNSFSFLLHTQQLHSNLTTEDWIK
jgi:hypothetical protein